MTIKSVSINNAQYPEYLRHISNPPAILYYLGDLKSALQKPRLAVVGARRVTPYGRQTTHSMTIELARHGICIVSGLALGIDGIAHQAALDGHGSTLAVMPGGLDNTYPKSHTRLAEAILASGGALVSEYPEHMPPQKYHFVERNRLVSGLCDAVLITEASLKSGSIHTANFALEQGKTVLAVPGNITSPLSEGTNNLIKSGAIPVTKSSDVLLAMGLESTAQQSLPLGDNPAEQTVIQLISHGLSDTTNIFTASKLELTVFNQTLSMLEITGKIRPVGGGRWSLA